MDGSTYKELREKLGLNQAELASKLEVSRETVSRRESEKVVIMEEAALAITALTGGVATHAKLLWSL